MEENGYSSIDNYNYKQPSAMFPSPFIFFINLISSQTDILSTCIVNLASPFSSLLSLFSDSFRRPKQDPAPSATGGGSGSLFLGRIAVGLLAAAYVCILLIVVMVMAAVLGVGLVRLWAEEPVSARESLHFDYSDAHPTAVFEFGRRGLGVPVGHTLFVSLILLMPESDYNREVGIFQLTAEMISPGGESVAKSSHPYMLRFRSWPIRLVHTFIMGVPLLLGITTETQTLSFPVLKHKEAAYPRTDTIRITLIPRAGTSFLPQFYDSEIVLKSRLPWMKNLVYSWKWTFYIWTTLYIFLMMVMVLVFFLKPVIFPVMTSALEKREEESHMELVSQEQLGEREVSETLRRLQQSRKKRKAALLHRAVPESIADTSASSITDTRGESFEEGSEDSESVCFKGFEI